MRKHTPIRFTGLALGALMLAGASVSMAQPKFGNPSPTAGSETSQKANASADQALYAGRRATRTSTSRVRRWS